MAEKSEKATPKKLRDARKKGQVAKSQDFPSAITFVVALAFTLYLSSYLYNKLAGFLVACFKEAPKTDLAFTAPIVVKNMLMVILESSLPIAIVVAAVGLLVGFLIVGPVFSAEVLKPDIKRLNVVENLKQKFKLRTWIELLKSILKICGAALLIYFFVKKDVGLLIYTITQPPLVGFMIFQKIAMRVILAVGIYFIIIAVADLIYQRLQFAKDMKMEKFDVKQEFKDTEGNPEIKGKRRQLAQEIAYDQGGINQVRKAKAVISNPHDVAIAIGYQPKRYKAPWILTMGTGELAILIIKEAEKRGVPVMRNVPLAHELLDKGQINRFVPESTYEAIGEILLYIESLGDTSEENEEGIH